MNAIGQMVGAKEDLKRRGEKKKKSVLSMLGGKTENDFEEFMALEKIRETEKELTSMMRLYGRPGLHDDWVRFQAEARKKRREEELAQKKQRAKNMEYFAIFIAVSMVIGGFVLLMVWVKWLAG
jgi:molecular chaperone GrpE (heat shock protein)